MRWVLDIVAVLALVVLIAGAVALERWQGHGEAEAARVAGAVRRLELEVKYRAATGGAKLNARGWPMAIDPAWFGEEPPRNVFLPPSAARPWLEIAPPEDALLLHPRVRMAVDERLSAFWYNPNQGIVRARVPVTVSDASAVELYNLVNGASLRSIFEEEIVETGGGEDPAVVAGELPAAAAATEPGAEQAVETEAEAVQTTTLSRKPAFSAKRPTKKRR